MAKRGDIIRIYRTKEKFCPICGKKQLIATVLLNETISSIRHKDLTYPACYEYCADSETFFIEEWQLQVNAEQYKKALQEE